ncbi:MAG: amidohydrolase family protein [Gemmatimonadota bacterium]
MTSRVYRARWVLPVNSEPVKNGAVAVSDERISYVGPAGEAPPGEVVDLGEAVLTPGLVNVHTHLELTAFRGRLEDLQFRDWIVTLTRARRAMMTDEARLSAARVGIAEGFLAGITTFGDCSDSGVAVRALESMDARGVVFLETFGPDPAQREESIDALLSTLTATRTSSPLVQLALSPHAPYSVSDDLFVSVARMAESRRLRLAVHVSESEAERTLVTDADGPFAEGLRRRGVGVRVRGKSPVALLDALGVMSPSTLLVHCVQLLPGDIELIARSGSSVAHCPVSNAKLGHGIAPVTELLDAGVTIGLGSDSVASNNRMDLLDEARLACLMQRVRAGQPNSLPAARVIQMATLDGARALGLGDKAGSLEVGKAADLAAFPLDVLLDGSDDGVAPETALVFGRAGRRACLTIAGGREVVRGGRLVADLRSDVESLGRLEWAGRLRDAIETPAKGRR